LTINEHYLTALSRKKRRRSILGFPNERLAALTAVAKEACEFYKQSQSSNWDFIVRDSIPIVLFGDLDDYWDSPWRVITVGLNPSNHEFPERNPWQRFPDGKLARENILRGDIETAATKCMDAVLGYFKEDRGLRVWNWFRHYGEVLEGMNYDYGPGSKGVVLNTDYISPLASVDGFSDLKERQQQDLKDQADGWWLKLADCLDPDLVLLSFREEYFKEIKWKLGLRLLPRFHFEVRSTTTGAKPKEVRMYGRAGTSKRFIFGTTTRYPFFYSKEERTRLGRYIAEFLTEWSPHGKALS
jgi:hypothetical protein